MSKTVTVDFYRHFTAEVMLVCILGLILSDVMLLRLNLMHRYRCQKFVTIVTRANHKRFPSGSIFEILGCDGGTMRGNMGMYIETYPDLGHIDSLSETLPTTTRSDWAPGMANMARMTQSALQNTCVVFVLFSSRRISDHLENGSCRLDLASVGKSECKFWSRVFFHVCNKC